MKFEQDLIASTHRILREHKVIIEGKDKGFYDSLMGRLETIFGLFREIYHAHPLVDEMFAALLVVLIRAHQSRLEDLRKRDEEKLKKGNWFLSNELVGMSLYVDRFGETLDGVGQKLGYLDELGVNFLHLMPIFQSPVGESDGGYAVSDFRRVDKRFGTLEDLLALRKKMQKKGMYLMLDIVLNHTSHHHEWAQKAKAGDPYYQDFFYMYDDRWIPNQFEEQMPEIFPESSPGNFSFDEQSNKWVMSVFHSYQWDLNFKNPIVFREMLDTILFYANLGVDVLRIDAPAFIWKQIGTTCQNLPQAHVLLQLIKQCVQVSASGMAILGEAIVAPREIMKYFGMGLFESQECDFAYNATQMALQWDMLASGDTRVMLACQSEILEKPYGTSWINYTRCHDDIGLGYDDERIAQTGKDPYAHRKFLKEYFAGIFPNSPAMGALFSFNPKTGDARISGSLASLCGLEKAIGENDPIGINLSIQKILLLQAHSFFLGGLPILFYGDEVGYTNDYSYLQDPSKSYDNRWMHRPVIDWKKNIKYKENGSIENRVFRGTQKLIAMRKKHTVVSDLKNIIWMNLHCPQVAGYLRFSENQRLMVVFNYSNNPAYLTWFAFKEHGQIPEVLFDHWSEQEFEVGADHEYLILAPYQFFLFESR